MGNLLKTKVIHHFSHNCLHRLETVTIFLLFGGYSQVIHKGYRNLFPPRLLKKILILTATPSEGEAVVARNLRDALIHLAPDEARVEMGDLLDTPSGRLQHLWKGVHQLLSPLEERGPHVDRLRDTLRAWEPDVVVSTCPVYNSLIGEIHRDGRVRDFTLVSLISAPLLPDSPWLRAESDHFAVIGVASETALRQAGVSEGKIFLGFPLPRHEGSSNSLPTMGQRPRILYLANSARKKAPKVIDRLLENPAWDITVLAEPDSGLGPVIRAKATTAPHRMKVATSEANLPQLLREHHVVISRAEAGIVQEAIAAGCPMIVYKLSSTREEGYFSPLRAANAGVLAEKPREVIDWLTRAFRDEARLLELWRKNLASLERPESALRLARFVLDLAEVAPLPVPAIHALPPPEPQEIAAALSVKPRLRCAPKKLLMCDLHTHTTWSDGKLSVAEMVDFYGQRGFDCLCITDHLCDPKRLLGKLVNLTGLVIPPDRIGAYFEAIEREKKRAWAQYDLLLMTGIEFNKDGYTPKTSTHLLGIDLLAPIDPSLGIKETIAAIHVQGGLAIASHPHEMKSHWGKDTLYLWENVDEYAPLLDAWEVANRDDIFNPVGLKKLPFVANSDFHKPKHIHSWKTLLWCEKEAEAIKTCIRVNRDVSLTLYRDQRFGLEERQPDLAPLMEYQPQGLVATGG